MGESMQIKSLKMQVKMSTNYFYVMLGFSTDVLYARVGIQVQYEKALMD
jgi:hypothetical protein